MECPARVLYLERACEDGSAVHVTNGADFRHRAGSPRPVAVAVTSP